jgi:hypothetical protein
MVGNLVNIALRMVVDTDDDDCNDMLLRVMYGLEFTLTVNPSDIHSRILQAHLYCHFNINLQEVR